MNVYVDERLLKMKNEKQNTPVTKIELLKHIEKTVKRLRLRYAESDLLIMMTIWLFKKNKSSHIINYIQKDTSIKSVED